jgi:hypothetical protein
MMHTPIPTGQDGMPAKQNINECQHINFKDTNALDRMADYMDHVLKEAAKTWLHPDNFNTQDSL